jgi:outer membrane protein assembly factor BamB
VSEVDNRKHRSFIADVGIRVCTVLAWVSGLASLLLFSALVVFALQVEAHPPLKDPAYQAVREAIQKDPTNLQLRKSAQALSLMSRRAFFTNQDQLNHAGLAIFFSVVVFLASLKTRTELTLRLPTPSGQQPMEGGAAERSASRWAVTAAAGLMVAITLFVLYLSPPAVEIALPAETAVVPAPAPAAAPVEQPPAAEAEKPVTADTWPAFRGPDAAGVAMHANAPVKWDGAKGENIVWKTDLPREGTGSVVVWGDRVFVPSGEAASRELYCIDAATGRILWTGTANDVPGSPGDKLKAPLDGVTWAPSTPAVDGHRVYAVFITGDIAAWSFDGKRVWARNLGVPKIGYGYASSLLVHGGRVLVQFDDENGNRFLALDGRTGKTVWETKSSGKPAGSWATPVLAKIGDGLQAILCRFEQVNGIDPLAGRELWTAPGPGGEVAPSASVAGGVVYVASAHSYGAAIRPGAEPKVLWKTSDDDKEALPDVASPVATGDHMILAATVLTCLSTKTGKKVWEKEFDSGFYGSPILVGDRVYVMDQDGGTRVFKLGDTYQELAYNPLGEKADATLAIPEGRIFLRSKKRVYHIAEAKK